MHAFPVYYLAYVHAVSRFVATDKDYYQAKTLNMLPYRCGQKNWTCGLLFALSALHMIC